MDIKEYYSQITDFKDIDDKIKEFNFAYKSNPDIKSVVEDTNKLIDLDYIKESNAIENEKTAFKIISWDKLTKSNRGSIVKFILSQNKDKKPRLSSNIIIRVTTSPHVLALDSVLNTAKSDKLENAPLSDFTVSNVHWDLLKKRATRNVGWQIQKLPSKSKWSKRLATTKLCKSTRPYGRVS